MKIGIIGMGHVGNITRELIIKNCEISEYDKKDNNPFDYNKFVGCEYIIVCVDTPCDSCGDADLSNVEDVFKLIHKMSIPIVLRSTVSPGTTELLQNKYKIPIAFWPEYIGETSFLIDTWERLSHEQPFVILGTNNLVFDKFIDFLALIYGPMCKFLTISPTAAEIVKYMENAYFAVKVTFVNEFREICEAFNVRWQDVREGWLLDPRIERDHSDAFANNRGFAGKCLPKDLSAIIQAVRKKGISPTLLEDTMYSNKKRAKF